MADDSLDALREAIRHSPENIPLRQHFAQLLASRGLYAEAAEEYKQALGRAPENSALKLGLAQAYYQQGKCSHALVIVEDLVRKPQPPPRAYILHARLLFEAGDVPHAVAQYKLGIEADSSAADEQLADRLGIVPEEQAGELFEGKQRQAWDDDDTPSQPAIERPKINFSDVGGMEALKEEIRIKIIYPLTHPEIYRAYGKPIGGGLLMYGPPGCGKTHLARATAGEIKAGFISIGISDVLDMWIGSSEKKLHALFDQARRNTPCVLFFDEVDALGASRSDMRSSGGRHLINQFLSEMDGIDSANDGVLILAATNAPWHLDSAFRRPGRFDRILFVPPPDAAARGEVLRVLCRGKPLETIDYQHLAQKTDSYSGADLKAVIDVAIEAKLRAAMQEGVPKPLNTKDLLAAARQVKPSTQEWFATARNYALYSNQGGLYDDILKYLKI